MLSPQPSQRLTADEVTSPWQRRAAWLGLALGTLGVLAVARVLHPDPRGFGTHTQLGLPPCAFHALTGLPCPTCGLTTSFAYMARWQITPAFGAHPVGVPLFVLTGLACGAALCGAARAWPLGPTFQRLRIAGLAVIIAVSVAAWWLVRLGALLLS